MQGSLLKKVRALALWRFVLLNCAAWEVVVYSSGCAYTTLHSYVTPANAKSICKQTTGLLLDKRGLNMTRAILDVHPARVQCSSGESPTYSTLTTSNEKLSILPLRT